MDMLTDSAVRAMEGVTDPLAPEGENTDWSREGIAAYLQEFVVSDTKEITTPMLAGKDMKVCHTVQRQGP